MPRVPPATRAPTRFYSFIFHNSLFDLQNCEVCDSRAPASANPAAVVSEGLRLRPFVAAARLVSARHCTALFFLDILII